MYRNEFIPLFFFYIRITYSPATLYPCGGKKLCSCIYFAMFIVINTHVVCSVELETSFSLDRMYVGRLYKCLKRFIENLGNLYSPEKVLFACI